MKTKLENWLIMSALLDFQRWNLVLMWMTYMLLWTEIFKYSFIFWIIYCFLFLYWINKYHNLWRKYYHFAICNAYEVEPKTLNLIFR